MELINWIADAWFLGWAGVYHLLLLLPYPSLTDVFKGIIGSFISFCALWYPRYKLDAIARRKYRHDHKRMTAPTSREHQAAAASVSSLFDH